jgi:short-subunit dehydrogenase
VVGLCEALRQELIGSEIDVSVVMPVGVKTELYSGLQDLRGMKTPEPEDVAAAIVEALQTGRFEVYVPKRMKALIRLTALVPRRTAEAIAHALGGNETITNPDHVARAAYEARIAATIGGHEGVAAERSKETV